MGNNSSTHSERLTQHFIDQHQRQWAHSFPRDIQKLPQFKVLPEDGLGQRLRPTDNGVILNSEGTIRGHRQSFIHNSPENYQPNGIVRSRSMHKIHESSNDSTNSRPRQKTYQDRINSRNNMNATRRNFGSEPDLRISSNSNREVIPNNNNDHFAAKNRISRGKKKYKAPAPPYPGMQYDSSNTERWDLNSNGDTGSDTARIPHQRKLRLFKTRMETNKTNKFSQKPQFSYNNDSSYNSYKSNYNNTNTNSGYSNRDKGLNNGISQFNDRNSGYNNENSKLNGRNNGYNNENSKFINGNINYKNGNNGFNNDNNGYNNENSGFNNGYSNNELKKSITNHVRNRNSFQIENPEEDISKRNAPIMARSLSSPEFQAELRAVTQKLRSIDKRIQIETNAKITEQEMFEIKKNKIVVEKSSIESKKMETMDPNNIQMKNKLINGFKEKSLPIEKTKKFSNDSQTSSFDVSSSSYNSPTKDNLLNRNKTASKESIMRSQSSGKESIMRGQGSGKESTPDQCQIETKYGEEHISKGQPTKTFYFGMNGDANSLVNGHDSRKTQNISYEKKPVQLKKVPDIEPTLIPYKPQMRHSSSESALSSSEPEIDDLSKSNISMQLRPTLPKKQLEIPRFSPAAAWRLLSVDTNAQTNGFDHEDSPVLMEERIEKFHRQSNGMHLIGQRSSLDKSGDSGISGDAGPPLLEEIPEPISPFVAKTKSTKLPEIVAWTPQQDLEEEASSSDDGVNATHLNSKISSESAVKYNARNQLFSLSLPRESHLLPCANNEKNNQQKTPAGGFNSLQKLRRSIGGALNRNSRNDSFEQIIEDDNWFLSTSAPNSINHISSILSRTQSYDDEDKKVNTFDKESNATSTTTMLKTPSFTYLASGGHVMYLPDTPSSTTGLRTKIETKHPDVQLRNNGGQRRQKPWSVMDKSFFEKEEQIDYRKVYQSNRSKSCENIIDGRESKEMKQLNRTPSPDFKFKESNDDLEIKGKLKTGKRFTFQSTVRQIERRRIAEKLSKEAERKEQQRLSELKAMQKVEEEFQRKRAKEKASIRQQLRMYTLDENSNQKWSQETTDLNKHNKRTEPDGADTSPAPSPTNSSNKLLKDAQTPYVNKLIEQRMAIKLNHQNGSDRGGLSSDTGSRGSHKYDSNKVALDIFNKRFNRSSPISRHSDENNKIKTEILSEYRQQTREYKDYRGFQRHQEKNQEIQNQVIHPPVICNLPKANQTSSSTYQNHFYDERSTSPISDNYRRDFAHGAIPTSSDSELSQPNTRTHSPKPSKYKFRARSNSPQSERNRKLSQNTNVIIESEIDTVEDEDSLGELKRSKSLNCSEKLTAMNNQKNIMQNLSPIQPKPFVANKSYKPVNFKVFA